MRPVGADSDVLLRRVSVKVALAVAAGSALGGVLRHAVGVVLAGRAPGGIVVATLAVNAVGSFVLAWLLARQVHAPLPGLAWAALTTGVLGGFTTYSTFNGEVVRHFAAGDVAAAGRYLAATVAGCLVAGSAGWLLGQRATG